MTSYLDFAFCAVTSWEFGDCMTTCTLHVPTCTRTWQCSHESCIAIVQTTCTTAAKTRTQAVSIESQRGFCSIYLPPVKHWHTYSGLQTWLCTWKQASIVEYVLAFAEQLNVDRNRQQYIGNANTHAKQTITTEPCVTTGWYSLEVHLTNVAYFKHGLRTKPTTCTTFVRLRCPWMNWWGDPRRIKPAMDEYRVQQHSFVCYTIILYIASVYIHTCTCDRGKQRP